MFPVISSPGAVTVPSYHVTCGIILARTRVQTIRTKQPVGTGQVFTLRPRLVLVAETSAILRVTGHIKCAITGVEATVSP